MKTLSKLFFIIFLYCCFATNSFANPKIYLSNEDVNFISDREIEISGDFVVPDFYDKLLCIDRKDVDIAEVNIYFEYITKTGQFKDVFMETQYDHFNQNPYVYSNGSIGNTFIHTVTTDKSGDYIYPVTDTNIGAYFLEDPYYNDECQFGESKDQGKIFHFHKIFTIWDIYPVPSYQYRVFVEFEILYGGHDGSSITYYSRDFYGPKDVPNTYSSSGIASFDANNMILHIPFLDMSNIGGNAGDTDWLNFKVELRNDIIALVLDIPNNKGGLGENINIVPSNQNNLAIFDPDTLKLTVPQLDLDASSTYSLELTYNSSLNQNNSEIVFELSNIALNPQDYSNALSLPCADDATFIRSLYQSIMDRDAEIANKPGYGVAHLDSLAQGVTRGALIKAFFRSPEYTNKNKGNEEFIRDAYQSILSREPTQNEISIEFSVSREAFLENLLSSTEYSNLIAACSVDNDS